MENEQNNKQIHEWEFLSLTRTKYKMWKCCYNTLIADRGKIPTLVSHSVCVFVCRMLCIHTEITQICICFYCVMVYRRLMLCRWAYRQKQKQTDSIVSAKHLQYIFKTRCKFTFKSITIMMVCRWCKATVFYTLSLSVPLCAHFSCHIIMECISPCTVLVSYDCVRIETHVIWCLWQCTGKTFAPTDATMALCGDQLIHTHTHACKHTNNYKMHEQERACAEMWL